jgi:hypothetical protein
MVVPAVVSGADEETPPRVKAKPKVGGPHTTFTARYVSGGSDADSTDRVYLNGPDGTRCDGEVIFEAVGFVRGKQRLDMGPRVPEDDPGERHYALEPYFPDREDEPPMKRWCRGVYRGGVYFERDGHPEDTRQLVRFRFRVE